MTAPTSDPSALPLFSHTARKDWGVGVLIREDEGKRAYLFEDGQERVMANGYHQLMRRVEHPNATQRAFYERQRGLLAAREKTSSSASRSDGPGFHGQLETLHQAYSGGLADPKWASQVRGEDEDPRAPRHRNALIRDGQEQLSLPALDALISSQNYGQVWDLVTNLLSGTDLVPASQLKKPRSASNESLRGLALAVRELLHGGAPYEKRFDAYLKALSMVVREPRWEVATALSAAVHPSEHICIHPASFRQELKVMGSRGTIPARVTGAVYTRFLSVARLVSNKLTECGPAPRDFFDVYDFIRFTLGPAARGKA